MTQSSSQKASLELQGADVKVVDASELGFSLELDETALAEIRAIDDNRYAAAYNSHLVAFR
jgi:hypothetical protein